MRRPRRRRRVALLPGFDGLEGRVALSGAAAGALRPDATTMTEFLDERGKVRKGHAAEYGFKVNTTDTITIDVTRLPRADKVELKAGPTSPILDQQAGGANLSIVLQPGSYVVQVAGKKRARFTISLYAAAVPAPTAPPAQGHDGTTGGGGGTTPTPAPTSPTPAPTPPSSPAPTPPSSPAPTPPSSPTPTPPSSPTPTPPNPTPTPPPNPTPTPPPNPTPTPVNLVGTVTTTITLLTRDSRPVNGATATFSPVPTVATLSVTDEPFRGPVPDLQLGPAPGARSSFGWVQLNTLAGWDLQPTSDGFAGTLQSNGLTGPNEAYGLGFANGLPGDPLSPDYFILEGANSFSGYPTGLYFAPATMTATISPNHLQIHLTGSADGEWNQSLAWIDSTIDLTVVS